MSASSPPAAPAKLTPNAQRRALDVFVFVFHFLNQYDTHQYELMVDNDRGLGGWCRSVGVGQGASGPNHEEARRVWIVVQSAAQIRKVFTGEGVGTSGSP